MCCFCQHPIEAARFCAGYLSEKRSQNLLAVEIFILNNAWQFQLNIKQDETSLRHVRVKLGSHLKKIFPGTRISSGLDLHLKKC